MKQIDNWVLSIAPSPLNLNSKKQVEQKHLFFSPFNNKNRGRRGGGQVVSMFAFYSDDPSSNLADAYNFFCNICVWKVKIKKKEAGMVHFLKKIKNHWNLIAIAIDKISLKKTEWTINRLLEDLRKHLWAVDWRSWKSHRL